MSPRFTFSDSEPEEGDLIPKGIYLAEIYNVEAKRNKADTANVWWWRARITAGPYEGSEPFPLMTVLPPGKGSFTFRPALRALNLPYRGTVSLEPEDVNALTPIPCGIEVANSSWRKAGSDIINIISVAEAATTLGAVEAQQEVPPF